MTKQRGRMGLVPLALAMAIGLAGAAGAAPTPEQKCEGGKLQAAGKYAACVAKAEKDLLLKGDTAKYSAAVAKCQTQLDAAYAKLEAAAEKKDAECPSVDDAEPVGEFLDECVDGVATALAGGDLPTCGGGGGGGLPATGQTTSYGAGSDGDVQAGTARSFTDNGDGTITDNVTGLMWEKKWDDGSIHDKDNGYSWSTGDDNMNGTMVTTFLADLNSGGGFAGHTDWRIPSRFELESLLNMEVFDPATYSEFNNGCTGGCTVTTCSCTGSGFYLSSTTRQTDPNGATGVFFYNGDTMSSLSKTGNFSVRAVRSGS
jgi:hypothetical protein